MKIIIPSLILAIILESTLISFPLTLAVIIFSAVIVKDNGIFLLAILAGLFLDQMSLNMLGISSLMFVISVFLIFQYGKKFEIKTLHFFATFTFLASYIYLLVIGSPNSFLVSLILTVISAISFTIYKKSTTTTKQTRYI